MSSFRYKLCKCCFLCGLLCLFAVCSAGGFVLLYGRTTRLLSVSRAEDLVLSTPFNDGGCELLGEDLIRGGNSLALWRDGVVIVSAGDLNTTLRHYSRGARGTGLFAVDLKAGKRPAVRALELVDWPKRLPPLVGQGLFLSNASGRLYVVNHGAEWEEEQPEEEQEYEPGEGVQAVCCCCGLQKWGEAVILSNVGNNSYWLWWAAQDTMEVVMARQIRRPKIKSRRETIVWDADPACPNGTTFTAAPLTLEECRQEIAAFPGQTLAEPFSQYLEDMPAGCFTHRRVRTFNLNANGSRRAGCLNLCKRIEVEYDNEDKMPIGVGIEEESPESFVEIFEILGEDFESLRLRHVDRVGSDAFPYQSISQVAEGRNTSEIYVLRELPWRSMPSEHNLVEGSRNMDGPVNWACSVLFWLWQGFGIPELGKASTWLSRNGKKLAGGVGRRYADAGPAGGDVAVVRCAELPRRPLADQGVPVRGGLRWSCKRTLKGLPVARGFAMSPDRSELLVGLRTRVMRYRIKEDGSLVEVGLPLQVNQQGWVTGLSWEEPDRVLYSFQPAPSLGAQHRRYSLQRPGVPAELAVGKPPDSAAAWWLSNFRAAHTLTPAPLDTVFRHDGSLLGGQVSSWVRHGGAVLMGSDWEEGLLYCPVLQPLAAPDIREGDRVWAQVDPTPSALRDWEASVRAGILLHMKGIAGKERYLQQRVSTLVLSNPASGEPFGMDAVYRFRPHPIEWRLATVLNTSGSGFKVAWDKAPPNSSRSAWRTAERLQAIPAAREPLRPGDRVEALDSTGQWRGATIEEEHGDGNVTVSWDTEVVGSWALRRREADGKLLVRFAPPGQEAPGTCAGRCLTDVDGPFSPQPGGHAFGWVPAAVGPSGASAGNGSEGSCSAEAAGEGGKCASPGGSGRPPAPQGLADRPVWELEVPNGFYEVTTVLRPGAASLPDCTLEEQPVEGTGLRVVQVADGRLTLGGCRGLVESLSIRAVPAEEAMSTPFFHAPLHPLTFEGRFEDHAVLEQADGRFLRRIPAGLTADNTTFVATVRGGSCGPRTSVSFRVDNATLRYFQYGEQAGWRPLREVRELSGSPIAALPTRIWTGRGNHQGWALRGGSSKLTFASAVESSDVFSYNDGWPPDLSNYCNGWPLFGGETVTLSFLAGPSPSAGAAAPGPTGPLQAGDRADLVVSIANGQQVLVAVKVTKSNPDGTFTIKRDAGMVEDQRLRPERIRRTQEAGYRRHRILGSPLLCRGRSSWTPPASTMNGCLRLCAVRPLCRFVAFLPEANVSMVRFNCFPSDECSELVEPGPGFGGSAWIYEKLDG